MSSRAGSGRGAVLAAVAAAYGTGAFLVLRADSSGAAPPAAVVLVAAVLLALVLWPLAARGSGVRSLALLLAGAQVCAQAALLLASGTLADTGVRSVVCCPATPADDSGPLAAFTAHAGWWLFAAQMAACLLLAFGLRTARRLLDQVLDSLASLPTLVAGVLLPLRLLLGVLWLRLPVLPAVQGRWEEQGDGPRLGLLLARAVGRRGPPAGPVRVCALPVHLAIA